MKIKTFNLLILVLISSCTSQSITISSSIPSPLVQKNQNISIITVYEDEIKNYLFESLMTVDLDKFEYLTPQLASNDKFSIWFKYKIRLYDSELDLFQNWDITGYGEQATGAFDNNQSMANAINIALRDVGANLTIQLEKEKNELLDLVE